MTHTQTEKCISISILCLFICILFIVMPCHICQNYCNSFTIDTITKNFTEFQFLHWQRNCKNCFS